MDREENAPCIGERSVCYPVFSCESVNGHWLFHLWERVQPACPLAEGGLPGRGPGCPAAAVASPAQSPHMAGAGVLEA